MVQEKHRPDVAGHTGAEEDTAFGDALLPSASDDPLSSPVSDLPRWAGEADGTGIPLLTRRAWPAWALGSLALISGIAIGWLVHRPSSSNGASNAASTAVSAVVPPAAKDAADSAVVVDVQGDVRRPGVYRLPAGARVADAVAAAGGFVHPEDARWINEAAPLDDGQDIVVPSADPEARVAASASPTGGDAAPAGSPGRTPAAGAESFGTDGSRLAAGGLKIDLNTADLQTLQTLPGIGPARANAIITYRQQHGRFRAVTELQSVPGIGPVLYERIAPFVTVVS